MPKTPKTPASSTRRRVVTSCTECHRRKQKCDRGQPCNFCVRREVPDKCSYNHRSQQRTRAQPYNTPSDVGDTVFARELSLVSSPLVAATDYVDTIGYAADRDDDDDDNNTAATVAAPLSSQPRLQHRSAPGISASTQRRRPQRYAHHILDGGSPQSFSHKYRLILSGLPSHTVLADLIPVFFTEVNAAAQILERCYFDKALVEWLTLTATKPNDATDELPRHVAYFPALVFQVLAMAVHFLPADGGEATSMPWPAEFRDPACRTESAQKYSSLGEELMTLLGRQGSTTCGVEHDILRAYWLKTTGRGTAAWHSLGTAIRQAQDQCLHLRRRPRAGELVNDSELWYDEYRRRLWATLFIWDSHMSLTLNRPRAINPSDCSIECPMDCDFPSYPTATPFPPQPRPQAQVTSEHTGPPSSVAVKLFSYDLGTLIHKIFASGAHRRRDHTESLAQHEREFQLLLGHLHPSLRPKRLYITIVANSFLLSLYRDGRDGSHHPDASSGLRRAAVESALAVLEAQEQILQSTTTTMTPTTATTTDHTGGRSREDGGGGGEGSADGTCGAYYYSMSCYTMDAAIFLAHTLSTTSSSINDDTPRQLEARVKQALRRSIGALETLRERSPLAECGVRILSASVRRLSVPDTADAITATCTVGARDGGHTVTTPALPPVIHSGQQDTRTPRSQQQQQHPSPWPDVTPVYPSPSDSAMAITLGNRLQQDVLEEFLLHDSLPDVFSVDFITDPFGGLDGSGLVFDLP
ncbi:hypothetical protein Micbo1qcDRAFT_209454 [Microdochium bolleyi]|uniref:Zn(2)-C6 fungal-type domain-containing protein n=1 Tax=Microdochium bolleyi TaxID=196109 RepID=A0A136IN46_9PEZI|nr:hypothetical protein Micbo1qcDRAFT_209454 [Microdochium bolleyi]